MIGLFGQITNTEESPEQMICVSETDCYPELFEPHREFKTVREGQQLPPGLHIRLNLETGLKEAKLNSDAGHQTSLKVASNHELAVVPVEVDLPIKDSILPPTTNEQKKQKTEITVQEEKAGLTLEEKETLKKTLGLLRNASEDTILTQLQFLSDVRWRIRYYTVT
jgi:hypothetical protein